MSKPLVDRFPLAKTVTVLAIAFGIGLGLCGLSAVLPSSGEEFHTNWLSLPSLLVMVFSFLGLIITLIIWVITSAIGSFSVKNSGTQTLFGDSEEDLIDKDQPPRE
jgi:hypothetical protein